MLWASTVDENIRLAELWSISQVGSREKMLVWHWPHWNVSARSAEPPSQCSLPALCFFSPKIHLLVCFRFNRLYLLCHCGYQWPCDLCTAHHCGSVTWYPYTSARAWIMSAPDNLTKDTQVNCVCPAQKLRPQRTQRKWDFILSPWRHHSTYVFRQKIVLWCYINVQYLLYRNFFSTCATLRLKSFRTILTEKYIKSPIFM